MATDELSGRLVQAAAALDEEPLTANPKAALKAANTIHAQRFQDAVADWRATSRHQRVSADLQRTRYGTAGDVVPDVNFLNAMANGAASSPKAAAVLQELADEAKQGGSLDQKNHAFLRNVIKTAETRREEFAKQRKDAEAEWVSLRATDPRYMTPSRGVTFDNSVAGHPDVAAEWDPANPCPPDQITYKANCAAWWRCRNCNHRWIAMPKNRMSTYDETGVIQSNCPKCSGRRRSSVTDTRDVLARFAASVSDNPDALNMLPPALRYRLLSEAGLLTGNDSMRSVLAVAIANGDVNPVEVVKAIDADTRGNGKPLDALMTRLAAASTTDDDHELTDTELARTVAADDTRPHIANSQQRLTTILDSAGAIGLSGDDTLAHQLATNSVEQLWAEASIAEREGTLHHLRARLATVAADDTAPYQQIVATRMLDEWSAIDDTPLPEGYDSTVTSPTGEHATITPNLMQRRFALDVEENRTVGNWWGTGAGKTLAAVVASRHIDARDTVVLCPLAVTGRWESEYRHRFPDVEVHRGLPAGNDSFTSDKPRVWIVNYDQLQGDATNDSTKQRLAGWDQLAGHADMVIMDEIHQAKTNHDAAQSQRAARLESFLNDVRTTTPDVAVVGMSATPVVNNLSEAKSVLKLITGGNVGRFGTAPTVSNAIGAYQAFSQVGTRWMPTYPTTLTRREVVVDVTSHSHHISAQLETEANASGGRLHPAALDRVLMPYKTAAMINEVRSATGPVIVYSHYVEGMTDPMVTALKDAGITAESFTGKDVADRDARLKRFTDGQTQVLVASQPITTGVDGLQHVSNKIVVMAAPWTAALDDQLAGRLQRTGQTRDVDVSYIVTEVAHGDQTWSADRKRLKRIAFKRGMADAAVDGKVPEGHLESEGTAASGAAQQLIDMLTH